MPKTITEDWTTALSVKELAGLFRENAESRYANTGRFTKLVSKAKGLEFFTPKGDDPFAIIGQTPAFAIGVSMPLGGDSPEALR